MRVKQVDREGIDVLVGLFGGRILTSKAGASTRRASYLWEITHQRAADACSAMLPFLQIKPQQAVIAVECMKVIDAGRKRQSSARPVTPGEPVVSLLQAARRAGRTPAAGYAAVKAGTVPHERHGNRIYVPESFIAEWARRPRRLRRDPETTDRLEILYQSAAALNRGHQCALMPATQRPENVLTAAEAAPENVLAYLAGVVDADGHIGIGKNTYKVRVSGDATQATFTPRLEIKQITIEALDLGKAALGGSRFSVAGQNGGQRMECLALHSAAAVRACEVLLPYLRIKAQQATQVIAVGAIHAEPGRRRFDIPAVVDGEPLVSLSEAASRAGRSYEVAYQSVRLANIPFVRDGRRILVPESYIPTWAARNRAAPRHHEVTSRLEVLFQECKRLNAVGPVR